MKFPVKGLLLVLCCTAIIFSCRKEGFTSSSAALLRTSEDSLHFDTVFTTTGSTSQFIKILNDNNKGIKVSSARLSGGSASPFKINVDGTPGPLVENVEIAANDSIYIYVTVSIDPTTADLPFIVRDSIEISYNGNTLWVQLDAFGQNAHFFRNKIISGNEEWNNDLPYIILGRLTVDTSAKLTINKSVRVHIHGDAPIIVHGTLEVNGEKYDSTRVVFTTDRLDEPYKNFPASYPGLIFSPVSANNILNYAIIKNAYQGIVAVDPSPGTKVTLNETIIDNAYDAGIIGVNTSITATNVLISNCGINIFLLKGGVYNFTHCTVAAFSNPYIQHKDPLFFLSNFISQAGIVTTSDLNATFRNCIFWGESGGLVEEEVIVSKEGNTAFNVNFDNVLWRLPNALASSFVTGNDIRNHPLFDSINVSQRFFDFRLKETSPAIDKGSNTSIFLDLDGNTRPVGLPDLGAYEKQ